MNNQPQSLFDYLEAKARHTDPVSSHKAAELMNRKDTVRGHAFAILVVMRTLNAPVTAVEIARHIKDFDRVEVSRRLSGLEDKELVEKCGAEIVNGKCYSLWRLKNGCICGT